MTLSAAISSHDINQVLAYLQQHPIDVNQPLPEENLAPMVQAASFGTLGIFQLLVKEYGGKIEGGDLFYAAKHNPKVFEYMKQAAPATWARYQNGLMNLYDAITRNEMGEAIKLLEAQPDLLFDGVSPARTPLLHAVLFKRKEILVFYVQLVKKKNLDLGSEMNVLLTHLPNLARPDLLFFSNTILELIEQSDKHLTVLLLLKRFIICDLFSGNFEKISAILNIASTLSFDNDRPALCQSLSDLFIICADHSDRYLARVSPTSSSHTPVALLDCEKYARRFQLPAARESIVDALYLTERFIRLSTRKVSEINHEIFLLIQQCKRNSPVKIAPEDHKKVCDSLLNMMLRLKSLKARNSLNLMTFLLNQLDLEEPWQAACRTALTLLSFGPGKLVVDAAIVKNLCNSKVAKTLLKFTCYESLREPLDRVALQSQKSLHVAPLEEIVNSQLKEVLATQFKSRPHFSRKETSFVTEDIPLLPQEASETKSLVFTMTVELSATGCLPPEVVTPKSRVVKETSFVIDATTLVILEMKFDKDRVHFKSQESYSSELFSGLLETLHRLEHTKSSCLSPSDISEILKILDHRLTLLRSPTPLIPSLPWDDLFNGAIAFLNSKTMAPQNNEDIRALFDTMITLASCNKARFTETLAEDMAGSDLTSVKGTVETSVDSIKTKHQHLSKLIPSFRLSQPFTRAFEVTLKVYFLKELMFFYEYLTLEEQCCGQKNSHTAEIKSQISLLTKEIKSSIQQPDVLLTLAHLGSYTLTRLILQKNGETELVHDHDTFLVDYVKTVAVEVLKAERMIFSQEAILIYRSKIPVKNKINAWAIILDHEAITTIADTRPLSTGDVVAQITVLVDTRQAQTLSENEFAFNLFLYGFLEHVDAQPDGATWILPLSHFSDAIISKSIKTRVESIRLTPELKEQVKAQFNPSTAIGDLESLIWRLSPEAARDAQNAARHALETAQQLEKSSRKRIAETGEVLLQLGKNIYDRLQELKPYDLTNVGTAEFQTNREKIESEVHLFMRNDLYRHALLHGEDTQKTLLQLSQCWTRWNAFFTSMNTRSFTKALEKCKKKTSPVSEEKDETTPITVQKEKSSEVMPPESEPTKKNRAVQMKKPAGSKKTAPPSKQKDNSESTVITQDHAWKNDFRNFLHCYEALTNSTLIERELSDESIKKLYGYMQRCAYFLKKFVEHKGGVPETLSRVSVLDDFIDLLMRGAECVHQEGFNTNVTFTTAKKMIFGLVDAISAFHVPYLKGESALKALGADDEAKYYALASRISTARGDDNDVFFFAHNDLYSYLKRTFNEEKKENTPAQPPKGVLLPVGERGVEAKREEHAYKPQFDVFYKNDKKILKRKLLEWGAAPASSFKQLTTVARRDGFICGGEVNEGNGFFSVINRKHLLPPGQEIIVLQEKMVNDILENLKSYQDRFVSDLKDPTPEEIDKMMEIALSRVLKINVVVLCPGERRIRKSAEAKTTLILGYEKGGYQLLKAEHRGIKNEENKALRRKLHNLIKDAPLIEFNAEAQEEQSALSYVGRLLS